jgi:hypothetical protein
MQGIGFTPSAEQVKARAAAIDELMASGALDSRAARSVMPMSGY